jgi:hypothetical protein
MGGPLVTRHGFLASTLGIVAALAFLPLVSDAARAEPPARPPSRSVSADPLSPHIAAASRRFGIPERWIRAVMRIESAGDPRAVSPKGAMGLMQIMPRTWAELRARYGLGADSFAPRDNILAGTAYMRELFERYGSPGFLAAYNAGPGRWEEHRATGRPLPAETRAYLAALAPIVAGEQPSIRRAVAADPLAWRRASLFAARAEPPSLGQRAAVGSSSTGTSAGADANPLSAVLPRADDLFVRGSRKESDP